MSDPDRNEDRNVPTKPDDTGKKERSAEFLVEEFDVATNDAAELVADTPAQADEIAARDYARQREDDPLEDVPTPHSPDVEPDERARQHMQKDVVRVRKE